MRNEKIYESVNKSKDNNRYDKTTEPEIHRDQHQRGLKRDRGRAVPLQAPEAGDSAGKSASGRTMMAPSRHVAGGTAGVGVGVEEALRRARHLEAFPTPRRCVGLAVCGRSAFQNLCPAVTRRSGSGWWWGERDFLLPAKIYSVG